MISTKVKESFNYKFKKYIIILVPKQWARISFELEIGKMSIFSKLDFIKKMLQTK